jgi:hypothetical protein
VLDPSERPAVRPYFWAAPCSMTTRPKFGDGPDAVTERRAALFLCREHGGAGPAWSRAPAPPSVAHDGADRVILALWIGGGIVVELGAGMAFGRLLARNHRQHRCP